MPELCATPWPSEATKVETAINGNCRSGNDCKRRAAEGSNHVRHLASRDEPACRCRPDRAVDERWVELGDVGRALDDLTWRRSVGRALAQRTSAVAEGSEASSAPNCRTSAETPRAAPRCEVDAARKTDRAANPNRVWGCTETIQTRPGELRAERLIVQGRGGWRWRSEPFAGLNRTSLRNLPWADSGRWRQSSARAPLARLKTPAPIQTIPSRVSAAPTRRGQPARRR